MLVDTSTLLYPPDFESSPLILIRVCLGELNVQVSPIMVISLCYHAHKCTQLWWTLVVTLSCHLGSNYFNCSSVLWSSLCSCGMDRSVDNCGGLSSGVLQL